MALPYFNGKPLNPEELEKDIRQFFKDLRNQVKKFIPLGSSFLFKFNNLKVFNIRPKIINPNYSTISKGDNRQTPIFAEFLGTPFTLDLADALKIGKVFKESDTSLTSEAGVSFSSFFKFDNVSSDYKKEDIYPINPASDYVFNTLPMKGNSPFLFKGFMGFSNYVQDTNIRFYPNSTGDTLTIKAKRLTLFIRSQNSTDFIVLNDLFNSETDRKQLECIHLNDININIPSTSVFDATTAQSGQFPTVSNNRDFGVWVVYNRLTNQTSAILTDWSVSYPTLNGVVRSPHPTWLSNTTANFKYYRCVACVHINANGKFEVSNKTAWGESSETLNGEKEYTELYQQDSEANPTAKNTTQTDDRRIVPSYYYLDQKNPSVLSLVNYSGIVRNIPGAGGNQVEVLYDTPIPSTPVSTVIKINSCELTDNKFSLWISGVNLNLSSLNPSNNFGQTDIDSGILTSGNGYYVWIVANPYSILDASDTNAPKNNLKIKLLITKSDTWRSVSSTWKTANPLFTFRCRLFWFRYVNNEIKPFFMKDGFHRFTNDPGASLASGGSVFEYSDNSVLASSTVNSGGYQLIPIAGKIPTDLTGNFLTTKHIAGRLAVTTSNASGYDNRVAVSSNIYGASTGGTPAWATPYQIVNQGIAGVLQALKFGTTIKTNIQDRYSLNTDYYDKLFYAVDLGTDSGLSGSKAFITCDEFYLPINGDNCFF